MCESSKPAMPELNLYIWYYADPELEPELRTWLRLVRDQLGYPGSLLYRGTGERKTFMEVYENVDAAAEARIEALAAKQPWQSRLQSDRRCEAFVPVFQFMD